MRQRKSVEIMWVKVKVQKKKNRRGFYHENSKIISFIF